MYITYGRSRDLSQAQKTALARYRHKIFIERLGWSLPVVDGEESDQFDHPDTLYVIATATDGAITGCARLLPTQSPYLLSEVFPHLLAGGTVPKARDIWELSRFSATPTEANAQLNRAEATRALLAAAVRCAAEQGAVRLITVSPLGIERLLLRMGVHSHRAGPPMLVDGKPVFACWIEIDEQTLAALDVKLAPERELFYKRGKNSFEMRRTPQSGVAHSRRYHL